METEKHQCKYLIRRSKMDCFIYYESTVFIVYTSVVCAFTIIDLMCEMHGNREASV